VAGPVQIVDPDVVRPVVASFLEPVESLWDEFIQR
jgi:hypothetical protein